MNKRKSFRMLVLSLLICFMPVMSRPVYADVEPGVGAVSVSYIVYNPDNGKIICGRGIDEIHFPASITKIMTALVAIEHCTDMNQIVTFTESAVTLPADSSKLHPKAKAGEQMTFENVLYGMFLASANECATMLAEFTAGSVEAFAALMNQRAAQIGCKNTHFVNAHGLHDDQHYTTAYDMALIFAEAMKNPIFRALASTPAYVIPRTNMTAARQLEMGHRIVAGTPGYACEGVFAGKTGRTPQAGRTLVTEANRSGVNLICVVMQGQETSFYSDTIGLLNYAYDVVAGNITPTSWLPAEEDVIVSNTNGGVNMRLLPTTDSEIIGRIAEGTVLHRIAVWDNYWSAINYSGTIYFVASAYVKPVTTVPPTTEEPLTQAPPETTPETPTQVPPTQTPPEETTTVEPTTIEPTTEEPTTAPTTEEVIEGETSLPPVSVVIIPDTDHTKATGTNASTQEGETEFGIKPIDDPSGATNESRASLETDGTPKDGKILSADSATIRKWMNICMIAMVVIFAFAVVTEFLPRRRKRNRRE
ncbi:MAG: D-alanyl-D-alanine carboxypeptidase [Lachnospiraceae bacterium]|nr:D-alanyl-D-alanine carboxypeptidase [Lachnospiraceae bacterium]